jgi:hypothetical protein
MSKLNILWTSDNAETAQHMIAMYATNALRKGWFEEAEIIIWGGSNTLILEDEAVQQTVKDMLSAGVRVQACKACADRMGTTELLEDLGAEVYYIGEHLSDILKDEGQRLLSV